MLSILIPVYNYDIRPLVEALQQQAEQLSIAYEIFALDDGSQEPFKTQHAELTSLAGVRYEEMPHNVGRSAIRNELAERARYDYLLYMDCDTMPEHADFLASYVEALAPNTVLYGGRSYQPEAPEEPELYFHWLYGSEREVSAAAQRKQQPYHSFMTNNFVIPKSLLLDIRFDEQLKQYGHEDTLFGLELLQRQIPIHHLDNPMRHIGLEPAKVFLHKNELAIQNLLDLESRYELGDGIKLLRYYRKTKRWGLHGLLRIWFAWMGRRLRRNLLGRRPKLRNFDLYKLGYMVSI